MVVLRPLEISDYQAWYAGFAGRHEKILPYDEGRLDMTPCTESWFENLVKHHQALREKDEQYIYGIFHQETGQHLGMIYLARLVRDRTSWAEVGYFIHNQHFRLGYGKKALEQLLEINRNELRFHRLEAQIYPGNEASRGLLEKCGFIYEGQRQQMRYENGQWHPQDIYVYLEDISMEE